MLCLKPGPEGADDGPPASYPCVPGDSHVTLSKTSSSSGPPVLSLFTEFPSNPLLRSADLPRLRALADKHDFLIVVDETLGNFVNVEVLPYADVVVSSLSKIFSGDANVMGGRCVFSSCSHAYSRKTLTGTPPPPLAASS